MTFPEMPSTPFTAQVHRVFEHLYFFPASYSNTDLSVGPSRDICTLSCGYHNGVEGDLGVKKI
jgi:hypothetical protein